jgi:hypothetical protein
MPFDNKNCTDIAAAVYIEKNNKDRRANSFIVSGLPSNKSTADDKRLIESLCHDEFGVSVDLIFVRRIGKETTTKPRNLLVYVRSRDQAQNIIQSAKKLRQSDDDFVRAHVFVNPNLTKAEAKAQFEIRQQRRRAGGIQRYASNQQVLTHTTDATQQIALEPQPPTVDGTTNEGNGRLR